MAAAGVTHHGTCNKIRDNAKLVSGVDINTYLRSYKSRYGVEPNDGITTKANAVEEGKMYYVCKNYIDKIQKVVDESPRRSVRLNSQTRTPIRDNADTALQVSFDFGDVREEHNEATYDDALEEEKERLNRVGHHTNFPKEVLSFKFRKPFGKMSYREKQRRSNILVKSSLPTVLIAINWRVRAWNI